MNGVVLIAVGPESTTNVRTGTQPGWRATARLGVGLIAVLLAVPASGSENGDVFDQFFRFADTENKAVFQDLPGETVDPFSGTLQLVQEDLRLPGRAGLDLRIVRTYSSKVWNRVDVLDSEMLLPEKEHSVLGYGWSFHMGRMRDPYAPGQTTGCGGSFPVFEGPDGTSHVFYPVVGSNTVFVSKDYWRLDKDCGNPGGGLACVWTDGGLRYEFNTAGEDRFWHGMVLMWPVAAVRDLHGNAISMAYEPGTGAVTRITDSYSRVLTFEYDGTGADRRLTRMKVGDGGTRDFVYEYTAQSTELGVRRFLTMVTPPAGQGYSYEYYPSASNFGGVDATKNSHALKTITYPGGGSATYTYGPVPFFAGTFNVNFAVVTQRTLVVPRAMAGTGSTTGTWLYKYEAPGLDCIRVSGTPGSLDSVYAGLCPVDPATGNLTNLNVTTITRPDGKFDTFTMVGFRYAVQAASDSLHVAYAIGLTLEAARADRAEFEQSSWGYRTVPTDPNSEVAWPISLAPFGAPVYSDSSPCLVWDPYILVPLRTARTILRDGAAYLSEYSDFDASGQPRQVKETGMLGGLGVAYDSERTTAATYFETPEIILRGRPLTQRVCVGPDCVDSAWSYDATAAHSKQSETTSGVTTWFGYDGYGNLSKVTNALGQSLMLSDYVHGVPTRIDYNHAITISRTATWEGRVESETNGRGFTTSYQYDAIGRVLQVTPPGGNVATSYDYVPDARPDGEAVRVTRGNYVKTSLLDGLGRETHTTDLDLGDPPSSEARQTSVKFDNQGRAWFKSYAWTDSTGEVGDYFDYDGLGRVITQWRAYRPGLSVQRTCGDSVAPGETCAVQIDYAVGCATTAIERGAVTSLYWASQAYVYTQQCFTSFGNPAELQLREANDGSNNIWRYAYTAAGKLSSVKAPNDAGNRSFKFDQRQFLTSETAGESGTTGFFHDAIGQVTSRTDARGVSTAYVRSDGLGRLTGLNYASEDDVLMVYDDTNNVTDLSSAKGGAYHYVFDELNRARSQVWRYRNQTYTSNYHYDAKGCLDSITYPTGTALALTCDAQNRTKSIIVAGSPGYPVVTDVTYHPSGQIESITYGNGIDAHATYDDRSRMKSLTYGAFIAQTYRHDGADNVVYFEDAKSTGSARWMGYDAVDRLVDVAAPGRWGDWGYQYDELGNRTSKGRVPVSGDYQSINYQYDGNNRLEVSTGPESVRPMSLEWDRAGRLSKTTDTLTGVATTYAYDGHGRRVEKAEPSETTVYHYDAAGRVIAETGTSAGKRRDYFYLGNKLIAVDGCATGNSPACAEWYHTDALGSVAARTNGAGTIVAQLDYQPWGEQWLVQGDSGDRQYNGRVYDPGTGFHDYGARMYWPKIGRFVSADSVMGSTANPMTLNRYSYVLNNPYKYVDPTGHYVEVQGGKMEAALKQLRATPTGERLYSQLRDSKNIFRLTEGSQSVSTKENEEGARRSSLVQPDGRRGSGGTTTIDFDKTYSFRDANGEWHEAPVAEVLGHEMKHLADYDNGHWSDMPDRSYPNTSRSEKDAVDVDNQFRQESGLPGKRVPGERVSVSPKKE